MAEGVGAPGKALVPGPQPEEGRMESLARENRALRETLRAVMVEGIVEGEFCPVPADVVL